MKSLDAIQHEPRVLWLRNRPAMTQHNDILLDLRRCIPNSLHISHAVLETPARLRANCPTRRKPHMRDHDIRACLSHLPRILHTKHIRRSQETHLRRLRDNLDFLVEPHPRLLQISPELPVDEPHGGEVLHARETHFLQLLQEARPVFEGVGAADAGDDGGVRDDGEDFGGHVHDYVVGVGEGHEPGERAASCHPEASAVVDDDQVAAAGFYRFGRQADAFMGFSW